MKPVLVFGGLCDGKHSVSEISEMMSRRSKESIGDEFVRPAIDQLRNDGLLDGEAELGRDHLARLSRREAIKRIGLGTTIGLPNISSLVAPVSSQAQSCLTGDTNKRSAPHFCDNGSYRMPNLLRFGLCGMLFRNGFRRGAA